MAGRPLFSIITPSFNNTQYFREMLESLRSQSVRDFEHLVMDGGSAPEHLLVIQELQKEFGFELFVERDRGMYDAVNKGFSRGRGTYCAYLNTDDAYLPDALERAAELMKRHPEAGLVFGDSEIIDQESRLVYRYFTPRLPRLCYTLMRGSVILQQGTFWPRSTYDELGGFRSEYRMAGDFDFFVRAMLRFPVRKIPGGPVARYRVHPGSLTAKGRELDRGEVGRIHRESGMHSRWFHKPLWAATSLVMRGLNPRYYLEGGFAQGTRQ